MSTEQWIPNIIIGHDYDQRYADALIHYDRHGNLADFFGRDMPIHRHAQYAQIHFIYEGAIHFHIDDEVYEVVAPACFFTPASLPHSFQTEQGADGHVLTIHQSIIWDLLKENSSLDTELTSPKCIVASELKGTEQSDWQLLVTLIESMGKEWQSDALGKTLALNGLIRLILISLVRLNSRGAEGRLVSNEDLFLFNKFSELIEQNFTDQVPLSFYITELAVSESRLNHVCHRISNRPPKKLIQDRTTQEAKQLLTFTTMSVKEISFALGFTDPAYFSRFFKRCVGVNALQFRGNSTKPG